MRARRPALGWFAAALIAASLAAGLLTVCLPALRATGLDLRVLEGVTLFLAAGAYLAYALAHHRNHISSAYARHLDFRVGARVRGP